jgi:hypothetical protein
MTTVVALVGEIGAEDPGPPAGAAVGGGEGLFREQGPDEAFRLAIGLGAIGQGEVLADPKVRGGDGEGDGPIGAADFGQEPLHDDAVGRVPGYGAPQ